MIALLPLVAAQDHAHGGGGPRVVVTHDLDADGYAVVGSLARFGFLALGEDGLPSRHHDARVTIEQNGVTLLDSAALHDYDGVGSVDYTFTTPGPFRVTATVDGLTDTFTGYAHGPPASATARLALTAPARVGVGEAFPLVYSVVDAEGRPIPHTDVLLEARRLSDDLPVFRAHTHAHGDAPQEARLALPTPGAYALRFTGHVAFPERDAPTFATFVEEARILVDATRAPREAARAAPAPPATHGGAAGAAGAAAFTLVAAYDPDDLVGPLGPLRASAVVLDPATRAPVPHVDFSATLRGPDGRTLFESASLHEYDGIFEVLTAQVVPGAYALDVTADADGWTDTITLAWTVVPPVSPIGAGAPAVTLAGNDPVAGVPVDLTFRATTAGAVPFAHGELDLTVLRGDGAPLATAKLHTHEDGLFPVTLAFPEEGEFALRVDPASTTPSATTPAPGAARVLRVSVGPGPGLPVVDDAPAPFDANAGAPALAAVAGLATAALAGRRGRGSLR